MNNDPTTTATDSSAALQAGQALAQSFLDFVARQGAALQRNAAAPLPLPLPDAGQLAGLQQQFMDRHARLWSGMLQRKPDQPYDVVMGHDPSDRRFSAPEWSQSPYFDYLRQAYLINAEFIRSVAEAVPLEGQAKHRLRFLTRQYVEAMAPSNFAATNPEFVQTALATKGESITRGIQNMLADLNKGRVSMTDESAFEIGRNLAVTPGAVVFENALIQLIQYYPLTERVAERPLLMVPACINKYYIMDLQPHNSLVRYLVEQGHTVFMLSWRNVDASQGQLGWDDYLEQGPLAALDVVRRICGVERVNTLGYCVGGTILAGALAVARSRGDDPAASMTLLTSLLDFVDAGEIGYFVDEAAVAAREAQIGKGGLLSGREMATMFSSLRANDLIWSYVVGNYLKGKTPEAFDILYWNSDSTNLPGPFLTWYVRHMYLHNSLRVPGKLAMCGTRVDLRKVDCPAYLFGTREDHIAPWTGTYLSRHVLGGETTYVLGASGHIAGVINPAAKNRRSYWTNPSDQATAADWLDGASENPGSWWPHWAAWLARFGGGEVPARGRLGADAYPPIEPAPGRYVKQRV